MKQQIAEVIQGLTAAKRLNEKRKTNEKSFYQPAIVDGTRIDEAGDYHLDPYYLLYKRYELLNLNARNNIIFLQDALKPFGFVFHQHVNTTATTELAETEQRVKQMTRIRREAVAAGLVEGTYHLTKGAGKEERELTQRFQRLNYLEVAKVSAEMLVNWKDYRRAVDRALYEHCRANTEQGFALNEKAAVWYHKFASVVEQVAPGTYDACRLRNLLSAATGQPAYEQQVNDVVGVVYDVARKRVRNGKALSYQYDVRPRKSADITKGVGICIPDAFFDVS